jgi:hypothetical protein
MVQQAFVQPCSTMEITVSNSISSRTHSTAQNTRQPSSKLRLWHHPMEHGIVRGLFITYPGLSFDIVYEKFMMQGLRVGRG